MISYSKSIRKMETHVILKRITKIYYTHWHSVVGLKTHSDRKTTTTKSHSFQGEIGSQQKESCNGTNKGEGDWNNTAWREHWASQDHYWLSPQCLFDLKPQLHVLGRVVFSDSEETSPQRPWLQTITFSPKHLPSFNGEPLFYPQYLRTWWKIPRARPQAVTGSAKHVPWFLKELYSFSLSEDLSRMSFLLNSTLNAPLFSFANSCHLISSRQSGWTIRFFRLKLYVFGTPNPDVNCDTVMPPWDPCKSPVLWYGEGFRGCL